MMAIIHNSMFIQCSIIFITGLIFSKLAKMVKLPAVTGYLVGGLLLGPFVLNFVTIESVDTLAIFSDIALAFIAFNIGSEFKLSYFKKVGIAPIVIACFESLFAVLFVLIVLLLTNHELRFSLMLSAIAAATAPAATIEFSPMVTPGSIIAPVPIHTFFFITILFGISIFLLSKS